MKLNWFKWESKDAAVLFLLKVMIKCFSLKHKPALILINHSDNKPKLSVNVRDEQLCFMRSHISSPTLYSLGLTQGEHAKHSWWFINIHCGLLDITTKLAFLLYVWGLYHYFTPLSPVRYPRILPDSLSKELKLTTNTVTAAQITTVVMPQCCPATNVVGIECQSLLSSSWTVSRDMIGYVAEVQEMIFSLTSRRRPLQRVRDWRTTTVGAISRYFYTSL